MVSSTVYGRFRDGVSSWHAWRDAQGFVVTGAVVLAWAALMGLLAQVRVPLPFTPVPFTMQVFGVFFGAVLLGARAGTLAQVAYVVAGAAGVPWFQGANGGFAYATGATGGYIVALPVAALVVALGVRALPRRTVPWLVLPMLAGLTVIYAAGAAWLAVALGVGAQKAFLLGVAPFVGADVAKAFLAAAAARALLPDEGR